MTFLNWPLPLSHQNYWLKNIQLPLHLSDLSALVYKWSISFQNICQVTDPPWGFRSVCVERDGERERESERESEREREREREREIEGVWLLARAGLFYSSGYRSVEQQLWADGNKEAWLSTSCPLSPSCLERFLVSWHTFHFQECLLCDDELQASEPPEETINYGVLYCLKVMECLKGFGEFISFLITYWHIIFLQRTLVVTVYTHRWEFH